jgi:hypothetical protein
MTPQAASRDAITTPRTVPAPEAGGAAKSIAAVTASASASPAVSAAAGSSPSPVPGSRAGSMCTPSQLKPDPQQQQQQQRAPSLAGSGGSASQGPPQSQQHRPRTVVFRGTAPRAGLRASLGSPAMSMKRLGGPVVIPGASIPRRVGLSKRK